MRRTQHGAEERQRVVAGAKVDRQGLAGIAELDRDERRRAGPDVEQRAGVRFGRR